MSEIIYANEKLPKLLGFLEFSETATGLWHCSFDEFTTMYVDFRTDKKGNPKGRRYAIKREKDKADKFIEKPDELTEFPALKRYKLKRDELMTETTQPGTPVKPVNKNMVEPDQRIDTPDPEEIVQPAAPQELIRAPQNNTTQEVPHFTEGIEIANMIKGFGKNFKTSVREVGKIKIGKRKAAKLTSFGTTYRQPEKHDYFTITTMERDQNGDLKPDMELMDKLGEKPTKIKVVLCHDDPSENFYTNFAAYTHNKRLCHGDGENAETSEGESKTCNPGECKMFQDKKCKPTGILSVMLADSPKIGGVYKFRTTSYNSIKNILRSIFLIQSQTGGILADIPLVMTVTPQTLETKTNMTVTIHTVNLEFEGTNEELANAADKARLTNKRLKGLELKDDFKNETKEETWDVAEEFYPQDPED